MPVFCTCGSMSALLAQTHFRRTWWMGASPASCDPVCHSARFSISVSASTLRFVQRPFTSLRHSASALPRFLRPEDHPVLMLCRCICRSAPIARHFCTKSSIYHPLVIVSTLDLIVLHRHPGSSVCSPCSSHRKACICSRRTAISFFASASHVVVVPISHVVSAPAFEFAHTYIGPSSARIPAAATHSVRTSASPRIYC